MVLTKLSFVLGTAHDKTDFLPEGGEGEGEESSFTVKNPSFPFEHTTSSPWRNKERKTPTVPVSWNWWGSGYSSDLQGLLWYSSKIPSQAVSLPYASLIGGGCRRRVMGIVSLARDDLWPRPDRSGVGVWARGCEGVVTPRFGPWSRVKHGVCEEHTYATSDATITTTTTRP